VPDLLLTFFFLGVPLLAGIAGSVLVWSAYSDLRSRPEEADAVSLARPRLPTFFALAAVPFFFGLALWFLVSGVEYDSGALQRAGYVVAFWIAAGYSFVTVVVVASQTWLARSRLREFISMGFGRVLPAMVIPVSSLVFALVLSFLALGRLPDFLANPPALSAAAANQFALVFQVYALASLGNLLGIGLSLRVREITTPRGFTRMLTFAEVASFLPIAALVWGFLQLGSI